MCGGEYPRPNMRLQRTRVARFARNSSPLKRRPLGGTWLEEVLDGT